MGIGGQGELRFGEPSVVAKVADQGRLVAVRDGKQLGAVFAGEARPQVGFGFDGEFDPFLASQDPAGLGEVTHEQGVPAEEVLVVARRLGALIADREELGPSGGEALPCRVVTLELGDVFALEVALIRKAIGLREREGFVPQCGGHFRGRPYVGRSFVVIGVGVERGREQGVRGAHLAEQPADRLGADIGVQWIAVAGPSLGVGAD